LNSSRAEMTSEWDDSLKDRWKALGLDSFARTGLGVFRAVSGVEEDGKKTIYVVTFELGKETLKYTVETSTDGKTFALTKKFVLTREAQPIGTAPARTP
jgi:hypothetical protein